MEAEEAAAVPQPPVVEEAVVKEEEAEEATDKDGGEDGGEGSEGEDGDGQATGAGGLQAQRQSTRRKPHVDLARLDVGTLRKYRRAFKIGDPQQAGTKEELLPAVVRHWQNQTVDEDETLLAFVFALRKQSTAAKKPGGVRGGSK